MDQQPHTQPLIDTYASGHPPLGKVVIAFFKYIDSAPSIFTGIRYVALKGLAAEAIVGGRLLRMTVRSQHAYCDYSDALRHPSSGGPVLYKSDSDCSPSQRARRFNRLSLFAFVP